jgi:hypothetical protein
MGFPVPFTYGIGFWVPFMYVEPNQKTDIFEKKKN